MSSFEQHMDLLHGFGWSANSATRGGGGGGNSHVDVEEVVAAAAGVTATMGVQIVPFANCVARRATR
jgi:hypothetical protein